MNRKDKRTKLRSDLLNQVNENRFYTKQKVGCGKTAMLVEFEYLTIVIEPKNTRNL